MPNGRLCNVGITKWPSWRRDEFPIIVKPVPMDITPMYLLIALLCFLAALASQFNQTRSAKLAEVSRFRELGVSEGRVQQFYQETTLQDFKQRLPSILLNGTLLSTFIMSVAWLASH
jgi:hypothetical protein